MSTWGVKSPQITKESTMATIIIIPPMVGVPLFFLWLSGPQPRMLCPNLILCKKGIRNGPINAHTAKAVIKISSSELMHSSPKQIYLNSSSILSTCMEREPFSKIISPALAMVRSTLAASCLSAQCCALPPSFLASSLICAASLP